MYDTNTKISSSFLVILCPTIPTIILYCLHYLQTITAKTYTINVTAYCIIIGMFFASIVLFGYVFLIQHNKVNLSLLIIGIFELILFQHPYVNQIFGFTQSGISIYLHGSFISIYLLIIILTIKEKRVIH